MGGRGPEQVITSLLRTIAVPEASSHVSRT
jgi:hypothetical protein